MLANYETAYSTIKKFNIYIRSFYQLLQPLENKMVRFLAIVTLFLFLSSTDFVLSQHNCLGHFKVVYDEEHSTQTGPNYLSRGKKGPKGEKGTPGQKGESSKHLISKNANRMEIIESKLQLQSVLIEKMSEMLQNKSDLLGKLSKTIENNYVSIQTLTKLLQNKSDTIEKQSKIIESHSVSIENMAKLLQNYSNRIHELSSEFYVNFMMLLASIKVFFIYKLPTVFI